MYGAVKTWRDRCDIGAGGEVVTGVGICGAKVDARGGAKKMSGP
jgi:hypothetical protein